MIWLPFMSPQVTIHATDHGPSPRTMFCDVVININDLDDNIPSFVMVTYPINIAPQVATKFSFQNPVITLCENVTVGSPVGTLADVARDVDAAPNNITYYYNPSDFSMPIFKYKYCELQIFVTQLQTVLIFFALTIPLAVFG